MRVVSVVIACLALVLGSSPPASAASRVVQDTEPDGTIAAKLDVESARFTNGPDAWTVRTVIRRPSRNGVDVFTKMSHAWEGYEVNALTGWRDGRKITRLWIWYNTVQRTRISCPGLRSSWELQPHGAVTIRIPHSCMFRGYPMDDMRVFTLSPPGAQEGADGVASSRQLSQG